MTDSKEDGLAPEQFTEDEKFALAAAAQAMHNHGIPIACPWEGDLDDMELERFVAMLTAIHAHNTALSASSPPVGGSGEVVVKPLEWVDGDGVSDARGYRIERGDNGRFYVRSNEASGLFGTLEFASTLDEAKAAAQADYETRIRSALAAPVPNGVPEGWPVCERCSSPMACKDGCQISEYKRRAAAPVTPEGLSGGDAT